jgi:hypothetical protein
MQKLQRSWVGSQHPPTHWYLWGGSEAVLNKEHKKYKKNPPGLKIQDQNLKIRNL